MRAGEAADVALVAPSTGLSPRLPFKRSTRSPCSSSWLRWALAKKAVASAWVVLPNLEGARRQHP